MSSVVTDSSTVVVSWNPAFSGMCDVFARDYTVRYRLSGGSGSYTTVNTTGTRVTLGDLASNAVYDVAVAAIHSSGVITTSTITQFTVTPTTAVPPSKLLLPPTVIKYFANGTISITSRQTLLSAQSLQLFHSQ